MEIPASARGAESSWTLVPDLSGRKERVSRSVKRAAETFTNAVGVGVNLQNVP